MSELNPASSARRTAGSLKRSVRVCVKLATACLILPPVAMIYLPCTVLGDMLHMVAEAADGLGKKFDDYWDTDSNAKLSHAAGDRDVASGKS